MTSLRIAQANPPAGIIDFGLGQPDPALWPMALIEQAAVHRLGQEDGAFLAYGVPQGDGYFRQTLADFLSEGYKVPVEAAHLLVTNGSSQGLDLVCTHFTQPGDTVFVEEPTYFLALHILADYDLKVVGIPVDKEGLLLDALEDELVKNQPAFLYTIPTFHNPTGITLSAGRRERLVALSEQHDFLLVADEVYHLLGYTAAPPPPLAHYDWQGTVISFGSFSKILAPGLRLGWIQAHPQLLQHLLSSGLLNSGGGLNPFTSSIVRSALELGLQADYLAQLRQTYAHRLSVLSEALRQALPAFTFTEPTGGFFVWGHLPAEIDSQALLAPAKQAGVSFQPGSRSSSCGVLQNYLRLSFAYYNEEKLREGVQRLAGVVQQFSI